MQAWGKMMMLAGLLFFVGGACICLISKYLPLGKLPGDFSFHSGNFSIYFPFASSIIISIALTIILNLFLHR